MNLFILDESPAAAAIAHCNKHVNKMIIETAQMLSTNHRFLDGQMFYALSKNGRRIKKWNHPKYDKVLYKTCHINHPSTVWLRQSHENYIWGYELFRCLSQEYTHRYKKSHATWNLLKDLLAQLPSNIPIKPQTKFSIAISDDYSLAHIHDPLEAYRQYYAKKHLEQFDMTWTNRDQPAWFESYIKKVAKSYEPNLERMV